MGRVEGKVAYITGAAKGQGRSHAIRLAEEGANIIAIDICREYVPETEFGKGPAMGTRDDLAQTVTEVESRGRRIIARVADTRDLDTQKAVVDEGVAAFGRLDIVASNVGIGSYESAEALPLANWQTDLDVNLTGTLNTVRACVPHIREGGRGGSITMTSSGAGLKGTWNLPGYVTTKHGLIGLMKALALELSPEMIRVNAIAPTTVNTEMVRNEQIWRAFRPDLENPTEEDVIPGFISINALPVPWVEPIDVSNALLFLCSSPPTRPATSPASRCPSTRATCSSDGERRLQRPADEVGPSTAGADRTRQLSTRVRPRARGPHAERLRAGSRRQTSNEMIAPKALSPHETLQPKCGPGAVTNLPGLGTIRPRGPRTCRDQRRRRRDAG